MDTMKEDDDTVIVSSDSEEDEDIIWTKKSKNKQFQLLWKKAKPIIFHHVLLEYKSKNFPYGEFKELAEDLRKSVNLVHVESTKEFIWKNIIRWLVSMKLCYEGISDLKQDKRYNLILADFMAQYVNYKCKLYCSITDESQVCRRVNEILFTLADVFNGNIPGILMTLLKIDIKDEYRLILDPVFRKYLSDRTLHETNELISYLRLIFCYRQWKKLARFKQEKELINEIAVGKSEKSLKSRHQSNLIDLTIRGGILPKKVPPVNTSNRPFVAIAGLIHFAIKRKDFGTRTLLIYKSLDLEEAIVKYFRQYEKFVSKDDAILSESASCSSILIPRPMQIENSKPSTSQRNSLPNTKMEQQEQENNDNIDKEATGAVNQLSSNSEQNGLSIKKKTQNRNSEIFLSYKNFVINVDDDDDEEEDIQQETRNIVSCEEQEGEILTRRLTDIPYIKKLKERAEFLTKKATTVRGNSPIVLTSSSDEEEVVSLVVPATQRRTTKTNAERNALIPLSIRPELNPAVDRVPRRIDLHGERPCRKEKLRCITGEVSSTTSLDCSSTLNAESSAVPNVATLETAREVGTLSVRPSPRSESVLANTDYSDISDDDNDDPSSLAGGRNFSGLYFSQFSKVVEEATSSTSEIPMRAVNDATSDNVIFSIQPSRPRRSLSSSPCPTRTTSPTESCANISPSSTIITGSTRPGTVTHPQVTSGSRITVRRLNSLIGVHNEGEVATCSRYVERLNATVSFDSTEIIEPTRQTTETIVTDLEKSEEGKKCEDNAKEREEVGPFKEPLGARQSSDSVMADESFEPTPNSETATCSRYVGTVQKTISINHAERNQQLCNTYSVAGVSLKSVSNIEKESKTSQISSISEEQCATASVSEGDQFMPNSENNTNSDMDNFLNDISFLISGIGKVHESGDGKSDSEASQHLISKLSKLANDQSNVKPNCSENNDFGMKHNLDNDLKRKSENLLCGTSKSSKIVVELPEVNTLETKEKTEVLSTVKDRKSESQLHPVEQTEGLDKFAHLKSAETIVSKNQKQQFIEKNSEVPFKEHEVFAEHSKEFLKENKPRKIQHIEISEQKIEKPKAATSLRNFRFRKSGSSEHQFETEVTVQKCKKSESDLSQCDTEKDSLQPIASSSASESDVAERNAISETVEELQKNPLKNTSEDLLPLASLEKTTILNDEQVLTKASNLTEVGKTKCFPLSEDSVVDAYEVDLSPSSMEEELSNDEEIESPAYEPICPILLKKNKVTLNNDDQQGVEVNKKDHMKPKTTDPTAFDSKLVHSQPNVDTVISKDQIVKDMIIFDNTTKTKNSANDMSKQRNDNISNEDHTIEKFDSSNKNATKDCSNTLNIQQIESSNKTVDLQSIAFEDINSKELSMETKSSAYQRSDIYAIEEQVTQKYNCTKNDQVSEVENENQTNEGNDYIQPDVDKEQQFKSILINDTKSLKDTQKENARGFTDACKEQTTEEKSPENIAIITKIKIAGTNGDKLKGISKETTIRLQEESTPKENLNDAIIASKGNCTEKQIAIKKQTGEFPKELTKSVTETEDICKTDADTSGKQSDEIDTTKSDKLEIHELISVTATENRSTKGEVTQIVEQVSLTSKECNEKSSALKENLVNKNFSKENISVSMKVPRDQYTVEKYAAAENKLVKQLIQFTDNSNEVTCTERHSVQLQTLVEKVSTESQQTPHDKFASDKIIVSPNTITEKKSATDNIEKEKDQLSYFNKELVKSKKIVRITETLKHQIEDDQTFEKISAFKSNEKQSLYNSWSSEAVLPLLLNLRRTEDVLTEEDSNLSTQVQITAEDLGDPISSFDSESGDISPNYQENGYEEGEKAAFEEASYPTEDQEVSKLTSQEGENLPYNTYHDDCGTPVLDEKDGNESESPTSQRKIVSLSILKEIPKLPQISSPSLYPNSPRCLPKSAGAIVVESPNHFSSLATVHSHSQIKLNSITPTVVCTVEKDNIATTPTTSRSRFIEPSPKQKPTIETDSEYQRTPLKMRLKRRISQCTDINEEFNLGPSEPVKLMETSKVHPIGNYNESGESMHSKMPLPSYSVPLNLVMRPANQTTHANISENILQTCKSDPLILEEEDQNLRYQESWFKKLGISKTNHKPLNKELHSPTMTPKSSFPKSAKVPATPQEALPTQQPEVITNLPKFTPWFRKSEGRRRKPRRVKKLTEQSETMDDDSSTEYQFPFPNTAQNATLSQPTLCQTEAGRLNFERSLQLVMERNTSLEQTPIAATSYNPEDIKAATILSDMLKKSNKVDECLKIEPEKPSKSRKTPKQKIHKEIHAQFVRLTRSTSQLMDKIPFSDTPITPPTISTKSMFKKDSNESKGFTNKKSSVSSSTESIWQQDNTQEILRSLTTTSETMLKEIDLDEGHKNLAESNLASINGTKSSNSLVTSSDSDDTAKLVIDFGDQKTTDSKEKKNKTKTTRNYKRKGTAKMASGKVTQLQKANVKADMNQDITPPEVKYDERLLRSGNPVFKLTSEVDVYLSGTPKTTDVCEDRSISPIKRTSERKSSDDEVSLLYPITELTENADLTTTEKSMSKSRRGKCNKQVHNIDKEIEPKNVTTTLITDTQPVAKSNAASKSKQVTKSKNKHGTDIKAATFSKPKTKPKERLSFGIDTILGNRINSPMSHQEESSCETEKLKSEMSTSPQITMNKEMWLTNFSLRKTKSLDEVVKELSEGKPKANSPSDCLASPSSSKAVRQISTELILLQDLKSSQPKEIGARVTNRRKSLVTSKVMSLSNLSTTESVHSSSEIDVLKIEEELRQIKDAKPIRNGRKRLRSTVRIVNAELAENSEDNEPLQDSEILNPKIRIQTFEGITDDDCALKAQLDTKVSGSQNNYKSKSSTTKPIQNQSTENDAIKITDDTYASKITEETQNQLKEKGSKTVVLIPKKSQEDFKSLDASQSVLSLKPLKETKQPLKETSELTTATKPVKSIQKRSAENASQSADGVKTPAEIKKQQNKAPAKLAFPKQKTSADVLKCTSKKPNPEVVRTARGIEQHLNEKDTKTSMNIACKQTKSVDNSLELTNGSNSAESFSSPAEYKEHVKDAPQSKAITKVAAHKRKKSIEGIWKCTEATSHKTLGDSNQQFPETSELKVIMKFVAPKKRKSVDDTLKCVDSKHSALASQESNETTQTKDIPESTKTFESIDTYELQIGRPVLRKRNRSDAVPSKETIRIPEVTKSQLQETLESSESSESDATVPKAKRRKSEVKSLKGRKQFNETSKSEIVISSEKVKRSKSVGCASKKLESKFETLKPLENLKLATQAAKTVSESDATVSKVKRRKSELESLKADQQFNETPESEIATSREKIKRSKSVGYASKKLESTFEILKPLENLKLVTQTEKSASESDATVPKVKRRRSELESLKADQQFNETPESEIVTSREKIKRSKSVGYASKKLESKFETLRPLENLKLATQTKKSASEPESEIVTSKKKLKRSKSVGCASKKLESKFETLRPLENLKLATRTAKTASESDVTVPKVKRRKSEVKLSKAQQHFNETSDSEIVTSRKKVKRSKSVGDASKKVESTFLGNPEEKEEQPMTTLTEKERGVTKANAQVITKYHRNSFDIAYNDRCSTPIVDMKILGVAIDSKNLKITLEKDTDALKKHVKRSKRTRKRLAHEKSTETDDMKEWAESRKEECTLVRHKDCQTDIVELIKLNTSSEINNKNIQPANITNTMESNKLEKVITVNSAAIKDSVFAGVENVTAEAKEPVGPQRAELSSIDKSVEESTAEDKVPICVEFVIEAQSQTDEPELVTTDQISSRKLIHKLAKNDKNTSSEVTESSVLEPETGISTSTTKINVIFDLLNKVNDFKAVVKTKKQAVPDGAKKPNKLNQKANSEESTSIAFQIDSKQQSSEKNSRVICKITRYAEKNNLQTSDPALDFEEKTLENNLTQTQSIDLTSEEKSTNVYCVVNDDQDSNEQEVNAPRKPLRNNQQRLKQPGPKSKNKSVVNADRKRLVVKLKKLNNKFICEYMPIGESSTTPSELTKIPLGKKKHSIKTESKKSKRQRASLDCNRSLTTSPSYLRTRTRSMEVTNTKCSEESISIRLTSPSRLMPKETTTIIDENQKATSKEAECSETVQIKVEVNTNNEMQRVDEQLDLSINNILGNQLLETDGDDSSVSMSKILLTNRPQGFDSVPDDIFAGNDDTSDNIETKFFPTILKPEDLMLKTTPIEDSHQTNESEVKVGNIKLNIDDNDNDPKELPLKKSNSERESEETENSVNLENGNNSDGNSTTELELDSFANIPDIGNSPIFKENCIPDFIVQSECLTDVLDKMMELTPLEQSDCMISGNYGHQQFDKPMLYLLEPPLFSLEPEIDSMTSVSPFDVLRKIPKRSVFAETFTASNSEVSPDIELDFENELFSYSGLVSNQRRDNSCSTNERDHSMGITSTLVKTNNNGTSAATTTDEKSDQNDAVFKKPNQVQISTEVVTTNDAPQQATLNYFAPAVEVSTEVGFESYDELVADKSSYFSSSDLEKNKKLSESSTENETSLEKEKETPLPIAIDESKSSGDLESDINVVESEEKEHSRNIQTRQVLDKACQEVQPLRMPMPMPTNTDDTKKEDNECEIIKKQDSEAIKRSLNGKTTTDKFKLSKAKLLLTLSSLKKKKISSKDIPSIEGRSHPVNLELIEEVQPRATLMKLPELDEIGNSNAFCEKVESRAEPLKKMPRAEAVARLSTDDLFDRLKRESPVNPLMRMSKPLLKQASSFETDDNSSRDSAMGLLTVPTSPGTSVVEAMSPSRTSCGSPSLPSMSPIIYPSMPLISTPERPENSFELNDSCQPIKESLKEVPKPLVKNTLAITKPLSPLIPAAIKTDTNGKHSPSSTALKCSRSSNDVKKDQETPPKSLTSDMPKKLPTSKGQPAKCPSTKTVTTSHLKATQHASKTKNSTPISVPVSVSLPHSSKAEVKSSVSRVTFSPLVTKIPEVDSLKVRKMSSSSISNSGSPSQICKPIKSILISQSKHSSPSSPSRSHKPVKPILSSPLAHKNTPTKSPSRNRQTPSTSKRTPNESPDLISSPFGRSIKLASLTAEIDSISEALKKLPEVAGTYSQHKKRKMLDQQLKELDELMKKHHGGAMQDSGLPNKSKSHSERQSTDNDSKHRPAVHSSQRESKNKYKEHRQTYVNKFGELNNKSFKVTDSSEHKASSSRESIILPSWDAKEVSTDEIIADLKLKSSRRN